MSLHLSRRFAYSKGRATKEKAPQSDALHFSKHMISVDMTLIKGSHMAPAPVGQGNMSWKCGHDSVGSKEL